MAIVCDIQGIDRLARAFRGSESLRALDISNNKLGGEALREVLLSLSELKNLEELDVGYNAPIKRNDSRVCRDRRIMISRLLSMHCVNT